MWIVEGKVQVILLSILAKLISIWSFMIIIINLCCCTHRNRDLGTQKDDQVHDSYLDECYQYVKHSDQDGRNSIKFTIYI